MHQVDTPTLEYVKQRYPDIVGWVPCLHSKDGTPHFNTTRFITARGTFVSVFSVKPVYYEALGGFWRPLSEVTTCHGNKTIRLQSDALRLMTPRYMRWLEARQRLLGSELVFDYGYMGAGIQPKYMQFATTSTFYPDPNPETTTMDGGILAFQTEGSNSIALWNELHDWNGTAAGVSNITSDSVASSDAHAVRVVNASGGINRTQIGRTFMLFDTSSIGSDTVDTATLSVYGFRLGADFNIGVVQSSPASNTALVADDFDQCGAIDSPVEGASRTTITTTTQYYDWVFNTTGESWVNTSGITKLGNRSANDMDDTYPSIGTDWRFSWSSADVSGTANDPKLVVEHSAGGGGTVLPSYIPMIGL